MSQESKPYLVSPSKSSQSHQGYQRSSSPRSNNHGEQVVPTNDVFQYLLNNHLAQANIKMNSEIDKVFFKEKSYLNYRGNSTNFDKKQHECNKCDCSGTSECSKKIAYLESKLHQYLNIPTKKMINRIYDIQKLGLDNQYYLVQYVDNSLERLSVKYLKIHYFSNYIQFLEDSCFGNN